MIPSSTVDITFAVCFAIIAVATGILTRDAPKGLYKIWYAGLTAVHTTIAIAFIVSAVQHS